MRYEIQQAKLSGSYKTVMKTDKINVAYAMYFGLKIEPGKKKRLTEDGKPMKGMQRSCYWT